MSPTNTMKMDAELSWFLMRYERDKTGRAMNTIDPWQVLEGRFPGAERRLLRELCAELCATGPWIPREIATACYHGAY